MAEKQRKEYYFFCTACLLPAAMAKEYKSEVRLYTYLPDPDGAYWDDWELVESEAVNGYFLHKEGRKCYAFYADDDNLALPRVENLEEFRQWAEETLNDFTLQRALYKYGSWEEWWKAVEEEMK